MSSGFGNLPVFMILLPAAWICFNQMRDKEDSILTRLATDYGYGVEEWSIDHKHSFSILMLLIQHAAEA